MAGHVLLNRWRAEQGLPVSSSSVQAEASVGLSPLRRLANALQENANSVGCVQFAQVFKHDGAGGRACAAARPAGLFARQSDGTDVSAAEDNKPPPPRSPSAGVPPASSPRPGAKVAPAKSPRGVPPPPQPTVKRPRRDASAAAAGPASPAAPRKASTPVTPAPSNSGSEDSFGAVAATATAAARPVPPPVRVPSVPEDDEALARRLHAELNCTPARSSRNRGGGQQQAAVGRDRIHGDDPGLLPSC